MFLSIYSVLKQMIFSASSGSMQEAPHLRIHHRLLTQNDVETLRRGLESCDASCDPGQFAEVQECHDCTLGTFCPGDNVAHDCPAGTASATLAAVDNTTCGLRSRQVRKQPREHAMHRLYCRKVFYDNGKHGGLGLHRLWRGQDSMTSGADANSTVELSGWHIF